MTTFEILCNLPHSMPSIMIPRVFHTIPWKMVRGLIEKDLHLGEVDRVDMIKRTDKNGRDYKEVYVHMKKWDMKNEIAVDVRTQLLCGRQYQYTYEEPWYWILTMSYSQKPDREQLVREKKHKPHSSSSSSSKLTLKNIPSKKPKTTITTFVPRQVLEKKRKPKKIVDSKKRVKKWGDEDSEDEDEDEEKVKMFENEPEEEDDDDSEYVHEEEDDDDDEEEEEEEEEE